MNGTDGNARAILMMDKRPEGMDDLSFVRSQAARAPLVRDAYGIIFALSNGHIQALLTGGKTRQVDTDTLEVQGIREGLLHAFMAHSLLHANGPRQTARLRSLARAFAWKLMADLRPEVRAPAEGLVAPFSGEVDFLDEVAGPLSAQMIGRIPGLSEHQKAGFAATGLFRRSRHVGALAPGTGRVGAVHGSVDDRGPSVAGRRTGRSAEDAGASDAAGAPCRTARKALGPRGGTRD